MADDTCRDTVPVAYTPAATPDGLFAVTALSDVHTLDSTDVNPTRIRKLRVASLAMLLPITVTVAAPVDATFVATKEDKAAALYDTAIVSELNRLVTVTATWCAAAVPLEALPVSALSDVHTLASRLLPPTRLAADRRSRPVFEPITVIDIDPVVPMLCVAVLAATRSYVCDSVTVVAPRPVVTVTDRPAVDPELALQPTELCDVHTVP